jgi:hypothetical protein
LVWAVEVIFYEPFSQPRIEHFRVQTKIAVVKPFIL